MVAIPKHNSGTLPFLSLLELIGDVPMQTKRELACALKQSNNTDVMRSQVHVCIE